MRVLLTNNTLASRAGTELYVHDVAIELMRRGHQPVAYSTRLGTVADELRAAKVPVVDRLDRLGEAPDIIHGQHHMETMTAMLWFPCTPAIYFCHGRPWEETPPTFPRILRYVTMGEAGPRLLLARFGIPLSQTEVLFNFYDRRRFPPRPPLPIIPKRALAFGNSFSESTNLPVLRQSCKRANLELDAVGGGVGQPEVDPGKRLAAYDIVFAYGRAALEALAVGTAVVLCDRDRLGPMVTTANVDRLRRRNFGMNMLTQPLDATAVEAELRRYDRADAAAVSQFVQQTCEIQPAVDRIEQLYRRVLTETQESSFVPSLEADRAAARYLHGLNQKYKEAMERANGEAEQLARELATMKDKDSALLEAMERANGEAEQLARELATMKDKDSALLEAMERANGEAEQLARELATMRGSLSWRWTQAMLNHPLVQRPFGRFLRTFAKRSERLLRTRNHHGYRPVQ